MTSSPPEESPAAALQAGAVDMSVPAESSGSQRSSKAPGLLHAAMLIAVVTVLSKILGALRDWQIMTVYGVSLASDAYFAAVQIPSFAIILLGGLGGPFHTATVAVFSKILKADEPASQTARKLAAGFISLTGVVFLALSCLVSLWALPIMQFTLPGAEPVLIQNAAEQLRIMTPVIFLGGLIGIFYGFLNVYNSFFWPSMSPAAMSLVMIAALLINPDDPTGKVLAWSTVGGALAQFLIQLPEFFRRGFSLLPAFDWKNPEIRRIGELLFPAVIGTTIGQLTVYVDMFFTSTLETGGWTAIVMGNRLIQLPIGVLQTALLVPIFPRFARYVEEKDWDSLKDNFRVGVVSLWFISIPMLVILLLYTRTIIEVVFQHGRFDANATELVTRALIFLSFSMIPYFARDSITRVFYAFHDSRTPLMIGLLTIGTKALFDWLLVGPFGVGGITFSTTLVTFLNMGLLGYLSRKHIQDLGFREMVLPFCKLAVSGLIMAVIMMLVGEALMSPTLKGFSSLAPKLAEFLKIAIASSAGLFTYTVTALAFQIPEAQYLFSRIKAILKR